MKKIIPTVLLSSWLAFWAGIKENSSFDTQSLVDGSKSNVSHVLKKDFSNQTELNILLDKHLSQIPNFTQEQKQEIKEIISEPTFKSELQSLLSREYNWSLESILKALVLWFLYWYAYYATIVKVKAWGEISKKSFWIFSFTSGWMVLVNGFIPGSLVYFESFILAFYVVYLHIKNKKWNKSKYDFTSENLSETKEDTLSLFEDFFEPISYCDIFWKPLLWNKKMTEETWYKKEEILNYYNEIVEKIDSAWNIYREKRWEYESLLYKWANLEKVKQYLKILATTKQWYQNITFTLTTKFGKEKTFLWNVLVDKEGWSLRFARYLSSQEEILACLRETEKKLLTDKLTGCNNFTALETHFEEKINNSRREKSCIEVMLDIDNFKWINDKFWHEAGDLVLKELVKFIQQSIRMNFDFLYRLHGDEFVILFESDNIEEISHKVDKIRQGFFEYTKKIWLFQWWIGTSYWITEIKTLSHWEIIKLEDSLKYADENMYIVKYFKLIWEELISAWIISKNYEEKNGIGQSIFDQNGVFMWVKVLNSKWSFFLSLKYIDLINKKRKLLDSKSMRITH